MACGQPGFYTISIFERFTDKRSATTLFSILRLSEVNSAVFRSIAFCGSF